MFWGIFHECHKCKKSQFNISRQNLSEERNFLKWYADGKITKIRDLLLHRKINIVQVSINTGQYTYIELMIMSGNI